MASAVVLTHAEFEGPGRLAPILERQGYALDVRAIHGGDEVPSSVAPGSLLVVMGGSMGVGDRDRPVYPFLSEEIELLQKRLRDRAPTLGVCLGAQLLAHAAGARVFPMGERPEGARYEVGWAPVHFERGTEARVLDGLPESAPMLHWHGDTFDLPPGARRLASTAACREQAFQIHDRLFGLQFHAEVDTSEVEAFLCEDSEFVIKANGPGAVDRLRHDSERHFPEFRKVSDLLLHNIVREMTRAPW
jgi:GMP synthase (glutamine-hydrolysing)